MLAVGSQAAAIAIAFLTGAVIDEGRSSPTAQRSGSIALAILAVGLARALLMMGRRLISGRQALGVEFDMRNALYAKLVRLSFGFYDRHQTGQLMSRATVDLQAVRFFLGYGLIFFFQHITTVVGVTAVMYVANWRLALAATAITPLIVIVLAYRYSRLAPDPARRPAEDGRRRHGRRGEHRRRPRRQVVRAGAAGVGQVPRSLRGRLPADVKANRQRALYVPLISFLPLLAQAAVLLIGGRMVANGSLTLGTFIEFNLFVVMLIMPLRMLGMWIGQAQRATASGERIFQVIDEPEEIADRPGCGRAAARDGRVRFEDVSFELRPRAPGAPRHRPRARARAARSR